MITVFFFFFLSKWEEDVIQPQASPEGEYKLVFIYFYVVDAEL